jgi:hypothetical protein
MGLRPRPDGFEFIIVGARRKRHGSGGVYPILSGPFHKRSRREFREGPIADIARLSMKEAAN